MTLLAPQFQATTRRSRRLRLKSLHDTSPPLAANDHITYRTSRELEEPAFNNACEQVVLSSAKTKQTRLVTGSTPAHVSCWLVSSSTTMLTIVRYVLELFS